MTFAYELRGETYFYNKQHPASQMAPSPLMYRVPYGMLPQRLPQQFHHQLPVGPNMRFPIHPSVCQPRLHPMQRFQGFEHPPPAPVQKAFLSPVPSPTGVHPGLVSVAPVPQAFLSPIPSPTGVHPGMVSPATVPQAFLTPIPSPVPQVFHQSPIPSPVPQIYHQSPVPSPVPQMYHQSPVPSPVPHIFHQSPIPSPVPQLCHQSPMPSPTGAHTEVVSPPCSSPPVLPEGYISPAPSSTGLSEDLPEELNSSRSSSPTSPALPVEMRFPAPPAPRPMAFLSFPHPPPTLPHHRHSRPQIVRVSYFQPNQQFQACAAGPLIQHHRM